MVICSEVRTKHINTPCGQNAEISDVIHGGTYSDRWALKGQHKDGFVKVVLSCLLVCKHCPRLHFHPKHEHATWLQSEVDELD
jgi:hypothetical protein